MNIKILLGACCLMGSSIAWAAEMESCPQVSQIKNYSGIYTAPTANGEGEWLGVISMGRAGEVKVFKSGVFYPVFSNSPQGTLAYCEYTTIHGVALNMRYRPNEKIIVNLGRLENWREGKGAYGETLYECLDPAPQACAFTKG